jgi:hypothetical protein
VILWDWRRQAKIAVLEGHPAPVAAVEVRAACGPGSNPHSSAASRLPRGRFDQHPVSLALAPTTNHPTNQSPNRRPTSPTATRPPLQPQMSIDGEIMASGDRSGLLIIWDATTHKARTRPLEVHQVIRLGFCRPWGVRRLGL